MAIVRVGMDSFQAPSQHNSNLFAALEWGPENMPILRGKALNSIRKHAARPNGVRTKDHYFKTSGNTIMLRKNAYFFLFLVKLIPITPR
jgi:hypothetical protein